MRQREEVSLRPSATHDPYPQCISTTNSIRPAPGLYGVHFRGISFLGNRTYHRVCRIRYETSLVPRLEGDTHPDHPTDLLVFSVIIYLVIRDNVEKVPIPRLLKTIAEDATYYFLVIFTSHLMSAMFLAFARVRISPYYSIISLRLA